jgi:hypothetical protein
MATTSIADLDLEKEEASESITPASSRAVGTYAGEATPDVQGEITAADLRLPRLNIGQKVGDLGDQFSYGGVILAKEAELVAVGVPLHDITVLKIRKQYQEKLKFDGDRTEAPRTFETAKEVIEAGLSINFGDEGYCERIAHMLLLVPEVEGLDEDVMDSFFYHSFNGKRYCQTLFTAAGTQFTESGKSILTAASKPDCTPPNGSIRVAKWNAWTIEKKGRGNKWWVLKVDRVGNNSPEFIEFTKTIAP